MATASLKFRITPKSRRSGLFHHGKFVAGCGRCATGGGGVVLDRRSRMPPVNARFYVMWITKYDVLHFHMSLIAYRKFPLMDL
jgi:hypothetical protein